MKIFIWLIGVAVALSALCCCMWCTKVKRKGKEAVRKNGADGKEDDLLRSLESVLGNVERRYIACELTQLMTEKNVDFAIRRKIWESYPREYGAPVVGVGDIAEQMKASIADAYKALSIWRSRRIGNARRTESDLSIICEYISERSRNQARIILKSFGCNE